MEPETQMPASTGRPSRLPEQNPNGRPVVIRLEVVGSVAA